MFPFVKTSFSGKLCPRWRKKNLSQPHDISAASNSLYDQWLCSWVNRFLLNLIIFQNLALGLGGVLLFFMCSFNVPFQISFSCCFIVTMLTNIFYSYMWFLKVLLMMILNFCFKVAKFTRILKTFMLCFFMSPEMTTSAVLILTLLTREQRFFSLIPCFNVLFIFF